MAEFLWLQGPPYGVCFGCGTSANDKGFVQAFTEVDVRRDGEIVGISDVFFCANCLYAMGRLVGTATPQETEEFARRELDLINETEKLKDEVMAWQERFLQLASLEAEDFDKLRAIKELNDANNTTPKPIA